MNVRISTKLIGDLIRMMWEREGGFLFISKNGVLRHQYTLPTKRPNVIFFDHTWIMRNQMCDYLTGNKKPASWMDSLVDAGNGNLERYLGTGVTIPNGFLKNCSEY
jgi:hypothetical protein